MRWLITGLVLMLCTSVPALADGGARGNCCADQIKHAADSCCPEVHPGNCPQAKCSCRAGRHAEESCIGIPVVDEGCSKIDPECCPRDDFRLLCCARDNFRLLCKKDCEPCKKSRRCKQDTCTTCTEHAHGDDGSMD